MDNGYITVIDIHNTTVNPNAIHHQLVVSTDTIKILKNDESNMCYIFDQQVIAGEVLANHLESLGYIKCEVGMHYFPGQFYAMYNLRQQDPSPMAAVMINGKTAYLICTHTVPGLICTKLNDRDFINEYIYITGIRKC